MRACAGSLRPPPFVRSRARNVLSRCLAGVSIDRRTRQKPRAHATRGRSRPELFALSVTSRAGAGTMLTERGKVTPYSGPAGTDRVGEVVDGRGGALGGGFVEQPQDLVAAPLHQVVEG